MEKPQPHLLTCCGLGAIKWTGRQCSLYIIPFLVEQKTEACRFRCVSMGCAPLFLLSQFLKLLTGLPVMPPPQVPGPWMLKLLDSQDLGCLFLHLEPYKCPWDPHHQPLEVAPQLLSLGHPVSLVINPEPDEMSHLEQTSAMPPGGLRWPSPVPVLSEKLEMLSCSHK